VDVCTKREREEIIMTKVDYAKLRHMLIDRKIKFADFKRMIGISPMTGAKISKDESVSVIVLLRICEALKCNIGDIMDVVHSEEAAL